MNENANQETRMIEMTYCGGKYYAGTEEFACGQRDEPCRKCLKRHIARLEAALVEADKERIGAEELAVLRKIAALAKDFQDKFRALPNTADSWGLHVADGRLAKALRAQATEGGAIYPNGYRRCTTCEHLNDCPERLGQPVGDPCRSWKYCAHRDWRTQPTEGGV